MLTVAAVWRIVIATPCFTSQSSGGALIVVLSRHGSCRVGDIPIHRRGHDAVYAFGVGFSVASSYLFSEYSNHRRNCTFLAGKSLDLARTRGSARGQSR